MIADWRADEDNTFRMTIEINKSKVSTENERLATLDYDDVFKAFICLSESLLGMDRDYILNRSKTLIEEEINNIKELDYMMEHNEKTTLSLTINGNKYSAEMNWDVNIDAMLDSFYGMCISATFQERTILEAMRDFAESKLEVININNIE